MNKSIAGIVGVVLGLSSAVVQSSTPGIIDAHVIPVTEGLNCPSSEQIRSQIPRHDIENALFEFYSSTHLIKRIGNNVLNIDMDYLVRVYNSRTVNGGRVLKLDDTVEIKKHLQEDDFDIVEIFEPTVKDFREPSATIYRGPVVYIGFRESLDSGDKGFNMAHCYKQWQRDLIPLTAHEILKRLWEQFELRQLNPPTQAPLEYGI